MRDIDLGIYRGIHATNKNDSTKKIKQLQALAQFHFRSKESTYKNHRSAQFHLTEAIASRID